MNIFLFYQFIIEKALFISKIPFKTLILILISLALWKPLSVTFPNLEIPELPPTLKDVKEIPIKKFIKELTPLKVVDKPWPHTNSVLSIIGLILTISVVTYLLVRYFQIRQGKLAKKFENDRVRATYAAHKEMVSAETEDGNTFAGTDDSTPALRHNPVTLTLS
ncbi:hypothetical protein SNE40_010685 [Patella caerulea]|uniref:Uncharacterized protein n=1 Tax=Patella caerulea TaxID=87958 RepID=A0AAN8K2E6_PATCE